MKRLLKRILIAVAVVAGIVILTTAVVAWRATRVPAWYATAVDQTPADDVADDAINRRFVPLQNWLARTSAGDLDAKPDADKIHTLELTEAEINAVLAKVFDHVRGEAETFRVRLNPGEIAVAFTWTTQGRTVSVAADVEQPDNAWPTVALGTIRLGNQSVSFGTANALAKSFFGKDLSSEFRAEVDALRKRGPAPRIDEQDAASTHTAALYSGRFVLDLLAGRAVSPYAFLTGRLQGDDWVATRVTRLSVTDGKLAVTFRMLSPAERAELLTELTGPLPGS